MFSSKAVPIAYDEALVQETVIWKTETWSKSISLKLLLTMTSNGIYISPVSITIEPLGERIQGVKRSRKRQNTFKETINDFNFHEADCGKANRRIHLQEPRNSNNQSANKIKPIFQNIHPQNGDPKSLESFKTMLRDKESKNHQELITEYYKLLTESDLANSDIAVDRIQDILKQAEIDDTLSLLLNEVDNLVLQQSNKNCSYKVCHIEYEKVAEVVKTHVASCDLLGSEFSRLMTKLSSLLGEIQDLRAREVLENSPESSQLIDTKVQSLTLLKREAKIEQNRRKLKCSLKDSY